MTSIMTEILSLLFSGLTETATSMGTAIVNMVKAIFLQTTEGVTSLNVFGSLIVIFAGISLALSLFRLMVVHIASLNGNVHCNNVICWKPLRAFTTV